MLDVTAEPVERTRVVDGVAVPGTEFDSGVGGEGWEGTPPANDTDVNVDYVPDHHSKRCRAGRGLHHDGVTTTPPRTTPRYLSSGAKVRP
ncbi:hypothetical protein N0B31_07080 [Salinirubellus salinus]|uniref:Uncharacterized protein n=1 Tax=Salinirubellus salinus TaxID=1364945 RepID=A0A9E7R5P9_9EURY|nr:hypothetical protein [Salinirubellus salinus]UWM56047.1 hypothetical protein N0B31_07080 [Salinirubellus salinus]